LYNTVSGSSSGNSAYSLKQRIGAGAHFKTGRFGALVSLNEHGQVAASDNFGSDDASGTSLGEAFVFGTKPATATASPTPTKMIHGGGGGGGGGGSGVPMIEYLSGYIVASKHAARMCTGAVVSVVKTKLGECSYERKMHSYYRYAAKVGTVNKAAISKIMIRYKDKKCTQFADSLRHQQLVEHYKTGCDIETSIMYTYQKKEV